MGERSFVLGADFFSRRDRGDGLVAVLFIFMTELELELASLLPELPWAWTTLADPDCCFDLLLLLPLVPELLMVALVLALVFLVGVDVDVDVDSALDLSEPALVRLECRRSISKRALSARDLLALLARVDASSSSSIVSL